MLLYLALGTAGSLAPDLDSDQSAPVRALFTLLSIAAAFVALFLAAERYRTVAELALIWLGSFLLCRWAFFALLARMTRHRGIFHSVPAAVFSGAATAAGLYHCVDWSPLEAWLGGGFVSFGYVVHLLLDELYSINVFGSRTKRSLGTAFKFWSPRSATATLAVYVLCIGAFVLAPDPRPAWTEVATRLLSPDSETRWWPAQGWFTQQGGEAQRRVDATTPLAARLQSLLARMGPTTAPGP